MASLRLALKASLEEAESQPPPKKKNSTISATNRHRAPDIFQSDLVQQNRKRSHSDVSISAVSTGDPRTAKKTPSRKGDEGREGQGDREKERAREIDRLSEREKNASVSHAVSSSGRKDTPAVSSETPPQQSAQPVSEAEQHERSTPSRKTSASKQSSPPSSPPPAPNATATQSSLPTPPPSSKQGVVVKGVVVDSARSKKKGGSGWAVVLEEEVGTPSTSASSTSATSSISISSSSSSSRRERGTEKVKASNKESKSPAIKNSRAAASEPLVVQSTAGGEVVSAAPGPLSPKTSRNTPPAELTTSTTADTTFVDKQDPDKIESAGEGERPGEKLEGGAVSGGQEATAASGAAPLSITLPDKMLEEHKLGEGGDVQSREGRVKVKAENRPLDCSQVKLQEEKAAEGKQLQHQTEREQEQEQGPDGGEKAKSSKKRDASALLEDAAEEGGACKDKRRPKDDADKEEDAKDKGKDKDSSGHQSPRAAAQLAKSRLSLSGTNKATKSAAQAMGKAEAEAESSLELAVSSAAAPPSSRKALTPREQKSARKKERDRERARAKAAAAVLVAKVVPAHWVACDVCGKWRSLPGSLDISALPEQWFCSMNQWDPAHNDCSKEEEEYVEPGAATAAATVPGLAAPRSSSSLSAMEEDGEGTGAGAGAARKKDRSPRGEGRLSRGKRGSLGSEDGEAEEGGEDEDGRRDSAARGRGSSRRRSKGGARAGGGDKDAAAVSSDDLDVVSWAQCNKCSKWRKVPSSIGSKLPDVWYCSMNTWAPEYAKCSTKEEVDEKVADEDKAGAGTGKDKKVAGAAGGRGKYVRGGGGSSSAEPVLAPGKTVVKKIQWVQCERKNCKKWRKIPIEVDLSTLPDQWFCEMNEWDPERAACDLAEDSDDESDQPANQAARTQLILGNSKGPGTLSFRRLIFGADGRIRPFYSEKNKNGYGLFSFTEVFRPCESDEYILPTRRIGYWASSSYDGSAKPKIHVPPKKRKASEQAPEVEAREPSFQTGCSSLRPDQASDLLDCILRLAPRDPSCCRSPACSASSCCNCAPPPPAHLLKALPLKKKCGLFRRMQLADSVVQNYLILFSGNPLPMTVDEVFVGLSTRMFFQSPDLESCRASLGRGELLDTLHRLDQRGLVEATYDNDGDLSFRLLLQRSADQGAQLPNPFPALLASNEPTPLAGKALPLKMRKRKIGLQSAPISIEPQADTVVSLLSVSSTSEACVVSTFPSPASPVPAAAAVILVPPVPAPVPAVHGADAIAPLPSSPNTSLASGDEMPCLQPADSAQTRSNDALVVEGEAEEREVEGEGVGSSH